MSAPKWLLAETLIAVHDHQLHEHGGLSGLRDRDGLMACLERPRSAYSYDAADLHELAAKYAHGLITRHPFVDGNKRIALIAAAVFLRINGLALNASEIDAAITFKALASGGLAEAELTAWLRANTEPL